MPLKVCFSCELNLSVKDFSKTQLKKYGQKARCKSCVSELPSKGSQNTRKSSISAALQLVSRPSTAVSHHEGSFDSTSGTGYSSESSFNSGDTMKALLVRDELEEPIERDNLEPKSSDVLIKRKRQEGYDDDRHLSKIVKKKKTETMIVPKHKVRVIQQAGDGNCLYRSLSHGLRRIGRKRPVPVVNHRQLREKLALWVLKNAKRKINGAEIAKWIRWEKKCDVRRYYEKQKAGFFNSWGGQIELCACSHTFKVNVNVFEYDHQKRAYKRTTKFSPFGENTCNSISSGASLDVLYVNGNHYDALEIQRGAI